MLTEFLVPARFEDSFWFNIVIFLTYIGILYSTLYFGRDILGHGISKLIESFGVLLVNFFDAVTLVVLKAIMLPVHFIEHILIQHFPIKGNRVNILNSLANETYDPRLCDMIRDETNKTLSFQEITKLEKAVIQYLDMNKYLEDRR